MNATDHPSVLVTGGSGFIGRSTIAELHARDYRTISLDHRVDGDRMKTILDAGSELLLGDVREAGAVSSAMGYATAGVIHLAGVLGTQETVEHPLEAADVNILGTINVLELARRYELPVVVICVGNHWMRNPYAITKRAAEELTNMAAVEWDHPALAVRALNAYGPDQAFGPVRKIIPTMVAGAVGDRRINVYGDGSQRMDMIHADDVAAGLVNALDVAAARLSDGITLELGTGVAPTVSDIAVHIAALVGELTGADVDIAYSPMRPGEEPASTVVADPDLVAPLLNLDTLTSWETGLEDVVPELIARLDLK